MRKHFLILMLLALLPLAGWAQPEAQDVYPVDISEGWTIQFTTDAGVVIDPARKVYTGENLTPKVRLINGTETKYIPAEKLNISWNVTDMVNVPSNGYFEVTVTPNGAENGTYGDFSGKKKIYVLKAELKLTGDAPAKASDEVWDGHAWPLVTTPATLENDFDGEAKIEYSIDNKQTWKTALPTATLPGNYEVWYRAEGNSNLVGIEPTSLGTVAIAGIPYTVTTDYTLPTGKADLEFTWENNKAKDLALINGGTVTKIGGPDTDYKGTMKYKFKLKTAPESAYTEYNAAIPEAHDAGTYQVMWKIFPTENTGYIAKEADAAIEVTIAAIEPTTVTSATGLTGLKYLGDGVLPQALLDKAGSASDGATPKYQVKAPGGAFGAPVDFADVTGSVAGDYEIKTIVPTAGNYTEKAAASTITVTIAKAKALTAAPTAIANLTWKNAPQKLFNAGANTVAGKVKYVLTDIANPTTAQLEAAAWKTDIDDASLKGSDAKTYYAWYQVTDANYETVEPTAIGTTAAPVKIAPATVSIIVNPGTKVYNSNSKLTTVIPDGGLDKFSVTNAVEGADVDVTGLKYYKETAGLGVDFVNVGTYEGALTALVSDVEDANAYGDNYVYTIVPGNLTITPRPIYVEAKGSTAKFGEAYDISHDYLIKGAPGGPYDASTATAETLAKIFTTLPVLTAPEADPTLPAVKAYDLAFTAGTPVANYVMDETKGENNDGYFINDQKFTVTEDPTHQLVITVLPHKQKYTGVAESWADVNEGVDYAVTGLIPGDVITKKPTFTRETPEKLDVKYNGAGEVIGYTLSADLAEVSNYAAHYPGGIIYNNSTFTIEPVELTATVNPQTILTTADTEVKANAAINKDSWTVKGLVGPDATTGKSVLEGTLAVRIAGTGAATLGTEDVYAKGIELTIKPQSNYILKADTQYGELRIITPATIELVDTQDMTEALKDANDSNTTPITFNSRTLKEDTWNTLILPFDIKVRDLSDELGYAVVDMLDINNADKSKVIFKITTGTIPANTPFMIKTDEDVNLQDAFFATVDPADPTKFTVKIAYTDETTCEVADKAGNKLTGAYKPQTVNDGEYYMNGEGNWKLYAGTGFEIKGERVKFTKASATSAAPTFYIEEGDGTMTVINGETTSIETISAEKLNAADGWYTLNGVKLQSMPTQKGIYINNGKKVVIK